MAGVFQQVMYRLGIKQNVSSAYHPESQEALERSIKYMLHTYCLDQEKDWVIHYGRDSVALMQFRKN